MSGIMLCRHRLTKQDIHKKLQEFYKGTHFGSSSRMKNLYQKQSMTNIDLDKFPASKARQLAKKLESSKSTAKQLNKFSLNH